MRGPLYQAIRSVFKSSAKGPPISITITADAEAKIREKVKSGQYASADAVIKEALRLLDEHERAALDRLRTLIDKGDQGDTVPLTPKNWAEAWDRALQHTGTPNSRIHRD